MSVSTGPTGLASQVRATASATTTRTVASTIIAHAARSTSTTSSDNNNNNNSHQQHHYATHRSQSYQVLPDYPAPAGHCELAYGQTAPAMLASRETMYTSCQGGRLKSGLHEMSCIEAPWHHDPTPAASVSAPITPTTMSTLHGAPQHERAQSPAPAPSSFDCGPAVVSSSCSPWPEVGASSARPLVVATQPQQVHHQQAHHQQAPQQAPQQHQQHHPHHPNPLQVPAPEKMIQRVKANKKERRRTQSINQAFSDLRRHIPDVPSDTKLSKIKTLRLAISYINYLMSSLDTDDQEHGQERAQEQLRPHTQRAANAGETAAGWARGCSLAPSRKPQAPPYNGAAGQQTDSGGSSAARQPERKHRTGWPEIIWKTKSGVRRLAPTHHQVHQLQPPPQPQPQSQPQSQSQSQQQPAGAASTQLAAGPASQLGANKQTNISHASQVA